MLFSGERSFHPRGYESDGCVTVDAFVSEVSAVEQPTPAGEPAQRVMSTGAAL